MAAPAAAGLTGAGLTGAVGSAVEMAAGVAVRPKGSAARHRDSVVRRKDKADAEVSNCLRLPEGGSNRSRSPA